MIVRRTFRVDGMHCPNCVMRVESIEDDLPGVRRAEASYREGRLVVEFDDGRVDIARILAQVERLGYRAEVLDQGARPG